MMDNGWEVYFGGGENVLKLDYDDGCAMYKYVKKLLNDTLYTGEPCDMQTISQHGC